MFGGVNLKYTYVVNYKNNDALRHSFNELTEKTFQFNFVNWFNNGFWTEKYVPCSLVDGIYLFGNDSVLDFYPKFGFTKGREYQYSKMVNLTDCNRKIKHIDMDDKIKRQRFLDSARNSACNERLSMNNFGLIAFWTTGPMRDQVYYDAGEDAYVIADGFIPTNKFEFIIASSEYVFRKPHKRIFELALRKAKLNAGDVWYCGDNAVFDVDGAAACGIFPVWYKGAIEKSNKHIPKSDCLIINDWNELIDRLKAL